MGDGAMCHYCRKYQCECAWVEEKTVPWVSDVDRIRDGYRRRIHELEKDRAETRTEIHELRIACEARTDERDVEREEVASLKKQLGERDAECQRLHADVVRAKDVFDPERKHQDLEDAARNVMQAYITERDNAEEFDAALEQYKDIAEWVRNHPGSLIGQLEGLIHENRQLDSALDETRKACEDHAQMQRERISSLEKQLEQAREALRWRPMAEIHEDYGPCVLINIEDPGYQEIGSNLDADFDASQWTHFTPLPPLSNEDAERLKGQARGKS